MFSPSLLTLLLLAASRTEAWGPDGHTIVAHIADQLLTPELNRTLMEDLEGVSLNNASDWNDDYDHSPEGKWSESLHFINYEGHACSFEWAKNCKDDICVAGAIANYTPQVFNKSLTKDQRFFALKFLIHMMGDIHQPLHVSSGDDIGGNAIKLPAPHFSPDSKHWSHYSTNLHSSWDGAILVQMIYDLEDKQNFVPTYHKWGLLSDELLKRLGAEWSGNKSEWMSTVASATSDASLRKGLAVVAGETAPLGCEYAYKYANGSAVKSGDLLDRDYMLRAKPIVEMQLARAGVRLAQVLNDALTASRAAELATVVV